MHFFMAQPAAMGADESAPLKTWTRLYILILNSLLYKPHTQVKQRAKVKQNILAHNILYILVFWGVLRGKSSFLFLYLPTGKEKEKCAAFGTGQKHGLWKAVDCSDKRPFVCRTWKMGFSTTSPGPPPVCPRTWWDSNGYCYRVSLA